MHACMSVTVCVHVYVLNVCRCVLCVCVLFMHQYRFCQQHVLVALYCFICFSG